MVYQLVAAILLVLFLWWLGTMVWALRWAILIGAAWVILGGYATTRYGMPIGDYVVWSILASPFMMCAVGIVACAPEEYRQRRAAKMRKQSVPTPMPTPAPPRGPTLMEQLRARGPLHAHRENRGGPRSP